MTRRVVILSPPAIVLGKRELASDTLAHGAVLGNTCTTYKHAHLVRFVLLSCSIFEAPKYRYVHQGLGREYHTRSAADFEEAHAELCSSNRTRSVETRGWR